MHHQGDITSHMRAILVDWLVEVSDEYKLSSETLYLAVSYIDRYPHSFFATVSSLTKALIYLKSLY